MKDMVKIDVKDEKDIIKTRQTARQFIQENLNFPNLDRIHALTAISELSRNMVMYAGGGEVILEVVNKENKKGIKITFKDKGPGIPDIESAMTPKPVTKYSAGMGLGLSGSKNLADKFDIKSSPGEGTTIAWIKWER